MPTSSGGLRYPASTDAVNVPGDMQKLAEDVDTFKAPIANPTFTGTAKFPDGSSGAPAITNTGDENTGLFFPEAEAVAIATNGVERARIESNGRLGLGIAAPGSQLHLSGSATQQQMDAYADAGALPRLLARRARGTSSSPTAVQTNDLLLQIDSRGYGATAFPSSYRAAIRVLAGENWTDSAHGTFVSVETTANGGTTTSERMRIDGNGLITGTGTSLGAFTSYTPTLGGTGWALGDGTAAGAYCRIGKVVVFRVRITFGSTSTFGASASPFVSLPLTAASATVSSTLNYFNCIYFDASVTTRYATQAYVTDANNVTLFHPGTSGVQTTTTATAPFTWASGDIITIHGVYEIA